MIVTYYVFEDTFYFYHKYHITVHKFRDVIDHMIAANIEKFTLILQYGDYQTTTEIGTFTFKNRS